MGCAPSHSEIIQHLAKNTLRPLKKPTARGSADRTHVESRKHSVGGGSANSNSESSENDQENAIQPRDKDQHHMEGNHCQNLPASATPARTPKLYNEETKREQLAAGARVAVSEVIVSQKYVPREFAEQKQHAHSVSKLAQQPRKSRKQKGQSPKQAKSTKWRQKSFSQSADEEKVDFPTSLVNAHQAAYAYLNPCLSKYDAVLSLIEQAAHTQLILQQMVSFLTLRFEEVNRILEEIAGEGERLVKDVGAQLAWPTGRAAPQEQPDLLQQLLLYTVNKMQETNGTVSSLTASALHEACRYLHSATDTFHNRLTVKQEVDKRLQRMITQLAACTRQQPQSKHRDTALHSEDSGIGGDTDSMKDCWNLEKGGRRTSSESSAYLLSRDSHSHPSRRQASLSHMASCASKSYDSTVDHQLRGTFYSPHEETVSSSVSICTSQCAQVQNRSFGSFESVTSTDCETLIRTESMDFCSLGEEDNEERSLDIIVGGTLQQPRPSLPESEAVRPAPKRINIPENEEMTFKMKDAISDRIQFVPINSGSNAWSDEESKVRPVRPSTAKACKTRVIKKRRSKSAESLKSKAEDPTLLELQRTQKDLSRRLEKMLQPKGANNKGGFEQRKTPGMPKLPTSLPGTGQAAPSTKLKVSLRSSFSILPSQEKMSLRKIPPGSCYQTQAQNQTEAQTQAQQTQAQSQNQGLVQGKNQIQAQNQTEAQTQAQQTQAQSQNQGPVRGKNQIQAQNQTEAQTQAQQTQAQSQNQGPVRGKNQIQAQVQNHAQIQSEDQAQDQTQESQTQLKAPVQTEAQASAEKKQATPCPIATHPQQTGVQGLITTFSQGSASLTTSDAPFLPQGSFPLDLEARSRVAGPLMSKAAPGRANWRGSITSSSRKLQAGAMTAGDQPWLQYKIINLRYAGVSCSPQENRASPECSPECPPEPSKPGPSPKATSSLDKAVAPATLSPHVRRGGFSSPPFCRGITGGPAPNPSPPTSSKAVPSPTLPSRNLCVPVGYTTPSASRKKWPNTIWGSEQPNLPASPGELSSTLGLRSSRPPPVPVKPSNLATDHQPPSLATDHQPPCLATDHQLPNLATDHQPPCLSTDHQLSNLATDHQPPSLATDHQPPSLATDHQPPSLATDHQSPSLVTDHQSPSLVTDPQLSNLATDHQLSNLATDSQPSMLVTDHQPPSLATDHQLSNLAADNQPPNPPVHRQPPSPLTHRQLPSRPAHHQVPSPLVHRQPPSLPSTPAHPQPPSPPVHRQPPSPPVHRQPPNPPVHRQPPSPPVHRQPPNPLVHRQPPSPPVHRQPPNPPVHRQPPSPPVYRQPPNPPVHRQPPSPPSPLVHHQPPSPPVHHQPPSAPVHRQPTSLPAHRQLPSPPVNRQPPSPLTRRQLPSPPVHRQLPSPPVHRQLPSPPVHRQFPNSLAHRQLPSPPAAVNSTSPLEKIPLDHTEKSGSNASSIFCPLSKSIFESQAPSPPVGRVNAAAQTRNIMPGNRSLFTPRATWNNNFTVRQLGDRPRRLTLSGVHPQPFVKKSHLPDFKTTTQSQVSATGSAASEPTLHSIGLGGSFEKDDDPWTRHYVSEMSGASRSISHPELCIVGQGLQ
ncbi:photoreceptor cilium actin regulator-like [Stegostoma tigrinum]|uniref:photoreceptor cilium actin regulator-like n=1 Tax=Stegostoma tigrinum TaxID=3053191 RepID=UPI00286FF97D|nr:photoreceptor cilium actin regulator-like [Stegostoma tigrinum]